MSKTSKHANESHKYINPKTAMFVWIPCLLLIFIVSIALSVHPHEHSLFYIDEGIVVLMFISMVFFALSPIIALFYAMIKLPTIPGSQVSDAFYKHIADSISINGHMIKGDSLCPVRITKHIAITHSHTSKFWADADILHGRNTVIASWGFKTTTLSLPFNMRFSTSDVHESVVLHDGKQMVSSTDHFYNALGRVLYKYGEEVNIGSDLSFIPMSLGDHDTMITKIYELDDKKLGSRVVLFELKNRVYNNTERIWCCKHGILNKTNSKRIDKRYKNQVSIFV